MPNVPWNILLHQLPTLMRAVDTLIDTSQRRAAARDTAPVLETLQQRLAAVEEQQRMSADLIKQLAENVNTMAQAGEASASASAAALRRVQMLATAGLIVALVACALAIAAWVRG